MDKIINNHNGNFILMVQQNKNYYLDIKIIIY